MSSPSRLSSVGKDEHWYDLFSRGARDWLRHNEKVREAVREQLVELLAGADTLTSDGTRRVQVPVRFLEHYRFRLRDAEEEEGVGQGEVEPGDVLRPARQQRPAGTGAGQGEGGVSLRFEFELDEIVEWLWEELALPDLRPKPGAVEEDELIREGWDRHGVKSRLDRRRTVKEAIKRRIVQPDGPAFTNDDLRFRQLVRRTRPATRAVVIFGLDASSSMSERTRKLAKTFFFWALQGIRRQYRQLEVVFIAHTTEAWEFQEEEFFRVTAQGGTMASTAFNRALEIVADRFDPALYNVYFFYASDGENYPEDRQDAATALNRLAALANFTGYVETPPHRMLGRQSELNRLFAGLPARNLPSGLYLLSEESDVWHAIRAFFRQQAEG